MGLASLVSGDVRADVCVYPWVQVRQVLGVVVDPDGRPISEAKVAVLKDDVQIAAQQAKYDGRFSFDGLAAGGYELRVEARGFMPGGYNLILYKPERSWRRMIRVPLDVGMGCASNITLVKRIHRR
jgi:hypothetical protein